MFSKCFLRFSTAILCMLLTVSMASAQGTPPPYGYDLERVNAESVTYRVYKFAESKSIDISDLDLAPDIVGTNPFKVLYWYEPDFKLLLLQKGLARLKDKTSASQKYIDAEQKARLEGAGMWYVSPTPTATPGPTATPTATHTRPSTATQSAAAQSSTKTAQPAATRTPTPTPTPKPNIIQQIRKTVQRVSWEELGKLALILISLYGGGNLVDLAIRFSRRHKVLMILLGRRSSGKSWLWTRLTNPGISEADLRKIEPTIGGAKRDRSAKSIVVGPYEVTLYLADLSGETESQIKGIHGKTKGRKIIWLFQLSTTPNRHVTYESAPEQKMDQNYISEQLFGAEWVAGTIVNKLARPQGVVMCIGKFDLFAKAKPTDTPSEDARALLGKTFKPHLDFMRKACKKCDIPYQEVYLSALTGAGADEVLQAVSLCLYKKTGSLV